MKSGIYKLYWPNGKYYIGQTLYLETRFKIHLRDLQKGTHFNYALQAEFNKQLDTLSFTIIEECRASELNEKEISYINLKDKDCLNIKPGGLVSHGENSPKFLYYDEQILEAFLILASNPGIKHATLAVQLGIDVDTIHDINACRGRVTHSIKDQYPEEFAKLLANKASNTRGKNTIVITNGIEVVTLVTGEYSEFCRKHGLHVGNLGKVIKGERNHTGGWKVYV